MREGEYAARQRETVAEASGLRVRLLALDAGESVPWHLHSAITDTFFCLAGPMEVHTREPEGMTVLETGDRCAVPPRQPHFVRGAGGGSCRFLAVQGVGEYDYVPLPSAAGDDTTT